METERDSGRMNRGWINRKKYAVREGIVGDREG